MIHAERPLRFVSQTRMEIGHGDCLHACLASILGCGMDEIPDLSVPGSNLLEQLAREDEFLASRGLRAIRCHMTGGYEEGDVLFVFDGYGIAWGRSPRGPTQHAVVVSHEDGMLRVIHDPHPDKIGIAGNFTGIAWYVPVAGIPWAGEPFAEDQNS